MTHMLRREALIAFLSGAALAAFAGVPAAAAQPGADERAVRAADAAFWAAFNACDAARMARFFTPDVEFYHDTTGLTRSRGGVVRSLIKGPCGTKRLHVRREAVAASIRYDPVPGLGAILTGAHRFLARRGDGPELPEIEARFAAIWQHDPDGWRMRRVLSYAHGPIPYAPPAAVVLPGEALARHVGRYRSGHSGDLRIERAGDHLALSAGALRVDLLAERDGAFFARDRDLRIEFAGDGLVVRERGVEVDRATRIPD